MKFSLQAIARCLLILAAAISLFLAWLALSSSGGVAGCADGAACSSVLSSSWAKVLGLPVALFGAAIYLAAAVLGTVKARFTPLRLALLLVIPAAAAWFVGVQLFAIGGLCIWCCGAHLLATAGALMLLFNGCAIEKRAWVPASAGALCAVSALAAVQLIAGDSVPAASSESIVDVYEFKNGNVKSSDPIATLSLLDGQITFQLDELPLVGVSRPNQVLVALSDYTCPHCRKLHDVLQTVGMSLGGELAILKLPATRKGTESAEIHRHMLALWKIDPKMHWTLERALIEGRIVARSANVAAEAIRLVGANRFAEANVRHKQWIGEQIAKTRKLQDANREKTGKGTLPQVIIGSELVMGAHADPAFYLGMIEEQFGMVAQQQKAPQRRTPRAIELELEDGVVQLGDVTPGTAVPFSVEFTNGDRDPLEIAWLNMGANITLEEFSRDEIDTDQTARVSLVLNVPEDGRQRLIDRSVTIHTSTGQAPATFRVNATVGATTVAQVRSGDGAE